MKIFDWLKKFSEERTEPISQQDGEGQAASSNHSEKGISNDSRFVVSVNSPMYEFIEKCQLKIDEDFSWDDLFVEGKSSDKLPGFELRSRRKTKLHYCDSDCIVTEASKTLYIIKQEKGKKIFFADVLPEAMSVNKAGSEGAILRSGNIVGYLNFETGIVNILNFQWQPFSLAVGKNFWLVGTRETYEGPGELYCFSTKGDYLWGLRFKEEFQTGFGLIKATAYHLSISSDNNDILVSTMDRLYRFQPDGKLVTRIAISDLREEEIKKREYQRCANLPKNPQTKEEMVQVMATEMAEQIIGGMERAFSLHTPLAGFIHDAQSDRFFILEDEGRLTSWDSTGKLLWVHSFQEKGGYITWLDDSVVVSLKSGHTFWINPDGAIRLLAELPKEAEAVLKIPEQDKYLIICEDRRRYEFDKHSGELIQGPEGKQGMRLFKFQNRLFFYDVYLWAAPSEYSWQTYQPNYVEHAVNTEEFPLDKPAPQVKTDKPFKKIWSYKNPEDYPIRFYTIDSKNKRLYIGRKKIKLSPKEKRKEEEAFKRNESFSTWNEVVCYDFSLNQLWAVPFFSELTSISASPDGDAVFVGLWSRGLAYDPARLIILDDHGDKIKASKTVGNPTFFHFKNSDDGEFEVYEGPNYELHRPSKGKWKVQKSSKSDDSKKSGEFGAGIHQISVGSYRLNRTGKKTYQISYNDTLEELKMRAAVYEAVKLSDTGNLLLRVGNKTLQALSPKIETIWKIKTKGNITLITPGSSGFLALSKEEILFITSEGDINWRLGCPPNSRNNYATWMRNHGAFLWETGNRDYYQITLASSAGQIIKSHLFKDVNVQHGIDITEDENSFVIPFNRCLECYEIR